MQVGEYVRLPTRWPRFGCVHSNCILKVVECGSSHWQVTVERALCRGLIYNSCWFGTLLVVPALALALTEELDQFDAFAQITRFNAGIKD